MAPFGLTRSVCTPPAQHRFKSCRRLQPWRTRHDQQGKSNYTTSHRIVKSPLDMLERLKYSPSHEQIEQRETSPDNQRACRRQFTLTPQVRGQVKRVLPHRRHEVVGYRPNGFCQSEIAVQNRAIDVASCARFIPGADTIYNHWVRIV